MMTAPEMPALGQAIAVRVLPGREVRYAGVRFIAGDAVGMLAVHAWEHVHAGTVELIHP